MITLWLSIVLACFTGCFGGDCRADEQCGVNEICDKSEGCICKDGYEWKTFECLPKSISLKIHLNDYQNIGFGIVFSKYPDENITHYDLLNVMNKCSFHSIICVSQYRIDNDGLLDITACNNCYEVFRQTNLNQVIPDDSNVYWHFNPSTSFGFSNEETIIEEQSVKDPAHIENRLLWRLGDSGGSQNQILIKLMFLKDYTPSPMTNCISHTDCSINQECEQNKCVCSVGYVWSSFQCVIGLANNIPVSELFKSGFRIVYKRFYSDSADDIYLMTLRESCINTSIICVGAGDIIQPMLTIVACGNCLKILKYTPKSDRARLEGGAWWYFHESKSFGFAPDGNRILFSGDYDQSQLTRNNRLSWRLRNSGSRAGNKIIHDNHLKYVFQRNSLENELINATYKGCYKDQPLDPELNGLTRTIKIDTVESCVSICRSSNFEYAGVQDGLNCFCGSQYGKYGPAQIDECNIACQEGSHIYCGGYSVNDIYELKPECTRSTDCLNLNQFCINSKCQCKPGFVWSSFECVHGASLDILHTSMIESGYKFKILGSYSSSISSSLFTNLRTSCKVNTVLCLGAFFHKGPLLTSILSMACGNCKNILTATELNDPYFDAGTWWYNNIDFSIGFSSSPAIYQNLTDRFIADGVDDNRLSWKFPNSNIIVDEYKQNRYKSTFANSYGIKKVYYLKDDENTTFYTHGPFYPEKVTSERVWRFTLCVISIKNNQIGDQITITFGDQSKSVFNKSDGHFLIEKIYNEIGTFEISVEKSDGQLEAVKSVSVVENTPPTGGNCRIDLFDGMGYYTKFTIECTGWRDFENDNFYYELYFCHEIDCTTPVFVDQFLTGTIITEFPTGNDDNNFEIFVKVEPKDIYNKTNEVIIPITVTSPSVLECESFSKPGKEFECSLIVFQAGIQNVSLDFGDNTSLNLTLVDGKVTFTKMYLTVGIFVVKISIGEDVFKTIREVKVKRNILPENLEPSPCNVSTISGNLTGFSLSTYFTIECSNWNDSDGHIVEYQYYATFLNNIIPIELKSDTDGLIKVQLPEGPVNDSNYIYLSVKVYDNDNEFSEYQIPTPCRVIQDAEVINQLANELNDPNSEVFQNLYKASETEKSAFVISFVIGFDNVEISNQENNNQSLSTEDIEAQKVLQAELTRKRASVKENLIGIAFQMNLTNTKSIDKVSNMLSSLTNKVEEISDSAAELASSKSVSLADGLYGTASKTDLNSIRKTSQNIVGTLGNVLVSVNTKQINKNLAEKKSATISNVTMSSSFNSFNKVLNILADVSQMKLQSSNETLEVLSQNIALKYLKQNASEMKNEVNLDGAKFKMPQFCQLNKSNGIMCENENFILQAYILAVPVAVSKAMQQITSSKSVSLSFLDESSDEINVTNSSENYEFFIPRNPTIEVPQFKNNFETRSDNFLKLSGLYLTKTNVSLHIQIRPVNSSISYFFALKKRSYPIVDKTSHSFDYSKIFCPKDLISEIESDISYYQFFLNMNATKDLNGFVGFGLIEMNSEEKLCSQNSSDFISPSMINESGINSNETYIRVFLSGCYYMDPITGLWLSDGLEVLEDTNVITTHCLSSHLTQFAGGWVTVPSAINFADAFANASFDKNLTIYITVILMIAAYVLVGIWSRHMDLKDDQKTAIKILLNAAGQPDANYFYEVLFFTGRRRNASTDSTVNFKLFGEWNDTPMICIEQCNEPKNFREIDSFLFPTKEPLGQLDNMLIYHDNNGIGGKASWFLKFVIVHDLQTRQKFYFICNRWLAFDEDDGRIKRLLPVCGNAQKIEFKYLFEKQTKQKLQDGHLWLSIVTKSILSSFTRFDRLTCCFVLLSLTMLLNILYYGEDSQKIGNEILKMGPVSITPQQISIGVISNLIIVPPIMLLVEFFRRCRKRHSKSVKLEEAIAKYKIKKKQRHLMNPQKEVNKISDESKIRIKQKLTFSWRWKVFAYLASYALVVMSLFLIIMKGITLGNEKSTEWLTSIMISLAFSMLISQPIQVMLVTFLIVVILRKYDDRSDLEYDANDRGQPIHIDYTSLDVKKYKKNILDSNRSSGSNETEDINVARRLEIIKHKTLRKRLLKRAITEIFSFGLFVVIVMTAAFQNIHSKSFHYSSRQEVLLGIEKQANSLDGIITVNNIWNWLDGFINKLKPTHWYNNRTFEDKRFMSDFSSIVFGYPILKQKRVVGNKCIATKESLKRLACFSDYSFFNEDKANYQVNWTSFNQTPHHDMDLNEAFKYTTSKELGDNPYFGVYSKYTGGGYVYKLKNFQSSIQENITSLRQHHWINNATRAVFLELTIFNPNLNLFGYIIILFEILPIGLVKASSRVISLDILGENNNIQITVMITFLISILLMIAREIYSIYRLKRQYFKQRSKVMDWLLYAFSSAGFAIFTYKMQSRANILQLVKEESIVYINLSSLYNWIEILNFLMGMCAFLATIKLIQLLKYHSKINYLSRIFKNSLSDLASFAVIFFIPWLAFIQMMYLFYNEKAQQFSSFIETVMTGFQIIMGKFEMKSILQADFGASVFIFTGYNVFIVLVMINFLIAIICHHFNESRNKMGSTEEGSVFENLLSEFRGKTNKISTRKIVKNEYDMGKNEEIAAESYTDSWMKSFEDVVEKLIEKFYQ